MEPPQPTQEQAADSIVLEEEIDPNYVPSEAEVLEYVKWLGMDLDTDKDLFWIAREGLMAPLPANWKPCKIKGTDDIYYFNFSTGESTWDHPCDEYYKRLYEEEKKKKEISLKESNDQKRAQAKQDIQTLIGKKEKKPKKLKSDKASLNEAKSDVGLAPVLDRKPLPGLKVSNPLGAIDKREDLISSGMLNDLRGKSNVISAARPFDDGTYSRFGSASIGEGKLNPLTKLSSESKQSKDAMESPRSISVDEPIRPHSNYMGVADNQVDRESKLEESSIDGQEIVTGLKNVETSSVVQKNQRNFLTFRGLDEESQQKAIAANLKFNLEKKEEAREDLRPMVSQLEQENAKLLSKLAFNEIELKNCKNELDSMTQTIDRHRMVTEELHKVKSEILVKEEELFSLKSKLRTVEYDESLLRDQLKSKDLDYQRVKVQLEGELDIARSKVQLLEDQLKTAQEKLEIKDRELIQIKSNMNSIPLVNSDNGLMLKVSNLEKENSSLRTNLDSKSKQLEEILVEVKDLQFSMTSQLKQKDEDIVASHAEKNLLIQKISVLELELRETKDIQSNSTNTVVPEVSSEALRKSIHHLESNNRELMQSLEKSKLHNNEQHLKLQNTIDELREKLQVQQMKHSNDLAEHQSSIRDSKFSIQDNEEKLAAATDEIQRLTLLLAKSNQECADLTTEIFSKTQKLLLVEAKERELTLLLEQSENVRKHLQESLDSKERCLVEADIETRRLKITMESEKDKLSDLCKSKEIQIKHLQEQISLVSSQSKSDILLTSSPSPAEDLVRVEKISQLEENLRQERYSCQLLSLELDKFKKLLDLKEDALLSMAKKDEDLLSANARIRSLELDISTNVLALQQKTTENLHLRNQFNSLQGDFTSQKSELESLREAVNIKDQEVTALRAELVNSDKDGSVNSVNILLNKQAEEIKVLTESLKVSRSENETQKNEYFVMRSDYLKLQHDFDAECSKLRIAEMELAHCQEVSQSYKATERLQLEGKEQENSRLRLRLRELEKTLGERDHKEEVIQEELLRLKQEHVDMSNALASERETSQQKDKKIRSFREELLQLQKRISDKDSLPPIVKSSAVINVSTQTDSETNVISTIVRTKVDKAIQCSAIMVDKSAAANINVTRNNDANIQVDVVCKDVGLQTTGLFAPEDHQQRTSDGLIGLRKELDQHRAETASLFGLIKNYESMLVQVMQQPLLSNVNLGVPPTSIKNFHNHAAAEHYDEDKYILDSTKKNFEESPIADSESGGSSHSEELKSVSEIQTVTFDHFRLKDPCDPDKLLDAMSSMFVSMQSSIYRLKLHATKCNRAVSRVERHNFPSSNTLNTVVKEFGVQLEHEKQFINLLTDLLSTGKSFIKKSKVEIERLKSSWKQSATGDIASSKRPPAQSFDKDAINAFTGDLNQMIRLVRLIQGSVQLRSNLVKEISNFIRKRSVKNQLELVEKATGSFNELNSDLEHLYIGVMALANHSLQGSSKGMDVECDNMDGDSGDDPQLEKFISNPSKFSNVARVGLSENRGFTGTPAVFQNFMTGSENIRPADVPLNRIAIHPTPIMNFPIERQSFMEPYLLPQVPIQSYTHRLSEIQKQLKSVQTKQVDSLKECDKHVSWLSGLIKEIDMNSNIPKHYEGGISISKGATTFEQFIL